MAQLTKSIVINAPAEKIYNYVQDPLHLPIIWPGLEKITDVEALPNGGVRCRYSLRVAGLHFHGVSEDIEVEPYRRVVTDNTGGGANNRLIWTYEPVDGGTKVTVFEDYHISLPLLGGVAESVLAKANEGDTEKLLANLKARMES